MFRILVASVALLVLITATRAVHAESQPEKQPSWSFLMSSGAMIPTGPQREALSNGALSTAQLTRFVRPGVGVTGTFGWARSRDRAFAGDSKVDVLTYDVGGEFHGPRWRADRALSFRPFAGVGVGGRSDVYRHLDLETTRGIVSYASLGGELGAGRVRLRVEARENLASFKAPRGSAGSSTRSDVAVTAGLRLVRK